MNNNHIIAKLKIGVIAILALVFLCSARIETYAATVNSLIAPAGFDLLGTGFNSLKRNFIDDNKCLKYSNNIETIPQNDMSNTTYCFVNSKKELADKIFFNFASNPGMTPDSTIISPLTEIIVNTTAFSANKITILAYWRQRERRMFSDDLPAMTDEGISTLKANRKKFFQMYGDKYISAVTFGKMFFIVYQADISNFSSYSTRAKTAIKRAMELNLKKIQGMKLSPQEAAFAADRLADVNISCKTYGTNLNDFAGPYSADDYKDLLKKVNNGPGELIERELKSYSNVYNRSEDTFYTITDYLNMVEQWSIHLANFDYILTNQNLSFDLLTQCRLAVDRIRDQIKLVYDLDSDARIPSTRETNNFNDLYNRYVTEMNISPRTYTLPILENHDHDRGGRDGGANNSSNKSANNGNDGQNQGQDKSLELDLSNINDIESIKIDCDVTIKKNIFGSFNRKPEKIILNIIDEDGNLSEVSNTSVLQSGTYTLYEGIKICDKFRISIEDTDVKSNNPWLRPSINGYGGGYGNSERNAPKGPDLTVKCSYTEKVNDIIWVYMHNKTGK